MLTMEQIEFYAKREMSITTAERRALCALALRGLEAEWRPIAEAPKDSVILLAERNGFVWVGQWTESGWLYYGNALKGQDPTHFMLLPSPPKEA